MESEVNKELIVSHFARKTSPLQRELIAQWLREPANEEQYYDWLEEWENRHPQYLAPTQEALLQYTAFLTENPHTEETSEETPIIPMANRWRNQWWFVAASILLLISVAAWLFQDQFLYQTYETAFGETRSIKLTDGSAVVLNANSSLRVPRWGFGTDTRAVMLTGEANFSVTHTPEDQKFVVKTANNLEVVVLGTEFTVFARKRGAKVVLNKGKVQVHYKEGATARQVLMKPGDLVTLDTRNHLSLQTVKESQRHAAWGEKRFVFDETPLQEVAYMLEENYGLQVNIKDRELAERVLMGSFRADNVDQLLQSISELLDIDVVRQGNHVQLKDK